MEPLHAGITGAAGGSGPSSVAAIDLAFQDVYGNRTVSSTALPPVKATLGYTDPLIGPTSWPGLAAGYEFLPGAGNSIHLNTLLQLRLEPYSPGAGVDAPAALRQASADAERYKQIYYQQAQPDVSFELSTNLGTVTANNARPAFTEFGANAYVYLETASQLETVEATTPGGGTLTSLGAEYSVTPLQLATANSSKQAARLFARPITIPQLRASRAGDSLASLAAFGQTASEPGSICPPAVTALSSIPARARGLRQVAAGPVDFAAPAGDISAGATALTPELVAQHNPTLPITDGLTLRIPEDTLTVPGLSGPAGSLAGIAASLSCNVYADFPDPSGRTLPIGLVGMNYSIKGMLAGDVPVTIGEEQRVTAAGWSFEDLNQQFSDLGLTKGEFAQAIRNVEGLVQKGAVLQYDDLVLRGATGPTTLRSLEKQYGDLSKLAGWNSAVANLFVQGSPVYLNSKCATLAESLDDIATGTGLTVEQLASANELTPLADGQSVAIPSLLRVPQNSAALFVPFSAATGDSLTGLATLFGTDAVRLGNLNAELRGILEPGVTVNWPGHGSAVTTASSSLRSVYLEIVGRATPPPFDGFLQSIAGEALLRNDAPLICPLPGIPAGSSPMESPPLSDICRRFHLNAASVRAESAVSRLASANRALDGFLRSGAVLLGPAGLTVTVGPHGTLRQIADQFQSAGKTVSVAELARWNADKPGIFTVGNAFLLPPRPIEFDSPVTPQIPPAGATGEAAVIFPIEVAVAERRQPWLVSPDFQKSAEVFTAEAPIPPASATSGPLSIAEFATQFEKAFAPYQLKVATSRNQDAAHPGETKAGMWAVNLGDSGIRKFDILQNEPRYYALRPLSTELKTFDRVPVSDYRSGIGLCWPPQIKNFESVDLDGWMRELLAAVDLALAAPYATAAFRIAAAEGPQGFANSRGVFAPGATGATCMPGPGATGAFGPRDYDSLVQSKQDIADGMAKLVESILELGPANPIYLDEARQAARQQMLARLSDAYNFNALVQFPVNVQSPFSSTWTPTGITGAAPRFSGTLTADLYKAGSGESLSHAAGAMGVSTAYLCGVLLDVRGIIRPGVVVEYAPPSKTTTNENTTIRELAAFFQLDTNLADESRWPAWRSFTGYLGNLNTLLNQGTTLPLARAARPVEPGDTIGSLEAFFNIGPAAFGHANEGPAKNLLRPGAKIDLDPQERNPAKKRFYQVRPDQTILDIVIAIGEQYPGIDIDVATLCILARDQQVMNPGMAVYYAGLSPDYSVTTAKVNLGEIRYQNVPDSPPLTFLLNVKDASTRRKIFLNLRYAITETEYGIGNVTGVSGYQSSSWLTFAIPPGRPGDPASTGISTAMRQMSIPLPLRAYPTPPSLLTQDGAAAQPDAATLKGAREWNYGFSYSSTDADQDTTYLEVSFGNRRRKPGPQALSTAQSLAELLARPLAQFIEVYEKLKLDLAQLPQLQMGGDPQVAAVAFQTLAELVDGVANAFRRAPIRGQLQAGAAMPRQIYGFQVETAADITGRNLEVLNLQLTGYTGPADGALGFTGPRGGWPEVWVVNPGGQTALSLERFGPTGASYLYPPNVPAGAPLTQRLQFDGRDIIQDENGQAGVYLTRNEDLISSGPLGLTGGPGLTGPIPTNSSFVYRTPMVRFIQKLTPLITNQTLIWVEGATGGGRRKLEAYLGDLVDALLDLGKGQQTTGEYTVMLSCSYAFPLGAAGPHGMPATEEEAAPELLATSPLLLKPAEVVGLGSKVRFVNEIAQAIRAWVRDRSIPIEIGRLVFQITVFFRVKANRRRLRFAERRRPAQRP